MGHNGIATPLSVTLDSTVKFRPLFFRASETAADEWIVGHEPSDTAVALPESGMIAIRHLQEGLSVTQTSEAVRLHFGEEIDIADLIEALSQLGLVEAIDDQYAVQIETIGQGWLGRIPPTAVSWLYSRPALGLFALIIIAGPVALLFNPAIRPRASDLLWDTSYTVDTFAFYVLGTFLLMKHELAHLLAARARGLNAELTFGHRLFYLVSVSRIAGIWKLPRRDRLLIYSAGMGSDCFVAGTCTIILLVAHAHLFVLAPALQGMLGLIIITEYLSVIWEFQIFLKTDVYHIVADLTDQHDLPDQARDLLLRLWNRLVNLFLQKKGKSLHEQNVPGAADQIRWLIICYTLLVVFGFIGSFIWLAFFLLPAALLALQGEMLLFLVGLHTGNMFAISDGAVAMAGQFACFALLLWSWLRSYRRRAAKP